MINMFEGVRRATVLQALYMMEVIERHGTDEALELLERAAERQGAMAAREIRRTLPPGLSPLEAGAEAYRRLMEDAGAEITEHRRDDVSVTFAVRRCPFYEAFLDVGVDCGMFLGGLCGNLTLPSMQHTLRHLDPRLRLEAAVTRESAEDICLERVVLDEPCQGTV
jgi:predicted ArsR family transcriptional regulator